MSDERKDRCAKHPNSEAGACWNCEGRPPDWHCTVCGRRPPCEHIHQHPSLTKASAMTRSDVMRAVEMYKLGACAWSTVEETIDRHERAIRAAWRLYLEKKEQN